MTLSTQQKSVYLMIFDATMIAKSVGRHLKGERTLREFKVRVFQELDRLTTLMDKGNLRDVDVTRSIERLSNEFGISWGQAQKPINVILKYHFYLTKDMDDRMKHVLHCPVDSVILKALGEKSLHLAGIDKQTYLKIQRFLQDHYPTRIDLDIRWDQQHLHDEGIL